MDGSVVSAFDFFDRAYIIHMPNVKRYEFMQEQLASLGVSGAQYIYANRPAAGFHMSNMRRAPLGEFGANLSHVKAIVHAIADRAERPLFLEDDAIFKPGAAENLATALASLPDDYSVLYMGGHPRAPARMVGKLLAKVGAFSFAESYSISGKALLGFYDFWCDRIGQHDAMYDLILGEFAAANKGFCVYPLLTGQPDGVSQISGKKESKGDLVERGWLNNLAH